MKVVGYLVQDQELARRTVKLMGKQAPDKQDPNAIALLQSVLEQRELAGTTELSARSSRRAQRL